MMTFKSGTGLPHSKTLARSRAYHEMARAFGLRHL